MTNAPLVSVVTATYNAARFLPLSIRSALAQTYAPVEVHVVDDGSTDDTEAVLQEFADDPRVHVHRQRNSGQASAKNRGIREARGELIAFLDADDIWYPDKLERQVPLLLGDPNAGVIYSDVSCMDEQGHEIPAPPRQYHSGRITDHLFIDNFVNFNTTVVKRECFVQVGMFDESLPMGIDWDLWLRMSTDYEFLYLDARTMAYRIWPGQMSKNAAKRFECTLRIMTSFIEQYPDVIPASVASEAWAHTYASRARTLTLARRRAEALHYLMSAIRVRPTYVNAWRGLAKLVLSR
jgi:glycosyltransferase involved in cell wall biosynthesis